jgi:acetolactate synthase small subunit
MTEGRYDDDERRGTVEFRLTAWLDNEPGVLDRALAAFTRRRIRFRHFQANADPDGHGLELSVVFSAATPLDAHRVAHQVARGVQVWAVAVEGVDHAVEREVALARVLTAVGDRSPLLDLATALGATVVATEADAVVLAFAGERAAVAASLQALAPWDVDAVARAAVALAPVPSGPLVPGLPDLPAPPRGPSEPRRLPLRDQPVHHDRYEDKEEDVHRWQPFTTTAMPIRPSSGSAR